MKEKTYTVLVTANRYNVFKITAKGALKAKKLAEQQFKDEYGPYWDSIQSVAASDWHDKGGRE